MSAARREIAWLVALGALVLVGLGSIGLVDYDEAAYAEVARAMWTSGDWLVPRLCGETFFEKPPLLYWVQALGFAVFGAGEVGARIGTALAGAATPLVLYAFARRPIGARSAFLAAVVLATSLELVVLSRVAFTDMLLMLWFTICLGALQRVFEAPARGSGWFALACVAAALAMLTKGAIGVLFPGAVALVQLIWTGRLRETLRPVFVAIGLPLVFGLGFSWYLLLGLTQPGGFGFMRDLFLEHHVGRFTEPMQGHAGSVFFYLPVLIVGMLPWSPFLPLAIARAKLRADDERTRFLRLFALFSLLVFVFFTIAATKLPNYLAPALPGFALLIGDLFGRDGARARGRAFAASLAAALAAALLLALTFALLRFVPARLPGWLGERAWKVPGLVEPFDVGAAPLFAALVLVVASALAFLAFRAQRLERVFASLALGFLCTWMIVFQAVLPGVDERFSGPLRRLAAHAALRVPADEPIVLLGLRHRPSVCFYGDRSTLYVSAGGGRKAQALLFDAPGERIGITSEPLLTRFPATERLEILEREHGYVLFRAPSGPSAR
jgi:4-amino-4-deoxy-L-arabinose transferase-like glycosyltransferase